MDRSLEPGEPRPDLKPNKVDPIGATHVCICASDDCSCKVLCICICVYICTRKKLDPILYQIALV